MRVKKLVRCSATATIVIIVIEHNSSLVGELYSKRVETEPDWIVPITIYMSESNRTSSITRPGFVEKAFVEHDPQIIHWNIMPTECGKHVVEKIGSIAVIDIS